MARNRPAYDLKIVKQLAREGKFTLLGRPVHFILNRYDGADPAEVAASVIEAIESENFRKSDELVKRPGTYADIYNGIECADERRPAWIKTTFKRWSGSMGLRLADMRIYDWLRAVLESSSAACILGPIRIPSDPPNLSLPLSADEWGCIDNLCFIRPATSIISLQQPLNRQQCIP